MTPAAPAREHVRCALCGNDDTRTVCVERGFPIVRCRICGLVYVNPRFSKEVYDGKADCTYEELVGAACVPGRRRLSRAAYVAGRLRGSRRDLELIQKVIRRRGRLLDVGCGEGFFLKTARDAGWQVQGVEKSRTHAPLPEYGLTVAHEDVTLVPWDGRRFDVVTFWDVLEHLPDPGAALDVAARVLSGTGILALRVPNADYLLLKQRIVSLLPGVMSGSPRVISVLGLYAPETHFYNFTARTIRGLLKKKGMRVILVVPQGPSAGDSRLRAVMHAVWGAFARMVYWMSAGRVFLSCSLAVIAAAKSPSYESP